MMHSSVCASDVRFVRPMFTGRVAQVPGEVSTTTKDGCPRCLAFGHLGEHGRWQPVLLFLDICSDSL
jgi:hypothetical protein